MKKKINWVMGKQRRRNGKEEQKEEIENEKEKEKENERGKGKGEKEKVRIVSRLPLRYAPVPTDDKRASQRTSKQSRVTGVVDAKVERGCDEPFRLAVSLHVLDAVQHRVELHLQQPRLGQLHHRQAHAEQHGRALRCVCVRAQGHACVCGCV